MKTIRFLTQVPGLGAVYNRGDIARFPADIAEALIDRDLADPVEDETPADPGETQSDPATETPKTDEQAADTPKAAELPLGKGKP
ncbi:hypothetical protein HW537_13120 [Asaia siamensis]